jgi:superfamily II DNA or RNA helicase
MDSDILAQCKIVCLVLKHNDENRKAATKMDYAQEIDFIVSNSARNNLIQNLALSQNGNTLVLYNRVEKHGIPLFKAIQGKSEPKRKVFFVSGSVEAEEREKIRELTEKEKNAIIVASMGTFSTGINIRNLHCIIFASPTKSQIKVLQSIGRGLRKSDDGRPTLIYDIGDDISWKSSKNYTLEHAISRVKIYIKEKFTYEIHEVPLP